MARDHNIRELEFGCALGDESLPVRTFGMTGIDR